MQIIKLTGREQHNRAHPRAATNHSISQAITKCAHIRRYGDLPNDGGVAKEICNRAIPELPDIPALCAIVIATGHNFHLASPKCLQMRCQKVSALDESWLNSSPRLSKPTFEGFKDAQCATCCRPSASHASSRNKIGTVKEHSRKR